MEDYEDMASTRLDQPPAPRGRGRRWLLIGALAFAFMLALGVGALLGSTQAAALASSSSSNSQVLADAQGSSNSDQSLAVTPGARGQCDALTVSSVSGNTIVAKTASGSSVTVHTTASTQYTQAGKAVAASPSTLAPGFTLPGRTTVMGALLPHALTSVNSGPPPTSD